jgi:hypothetical protein
LKAIPFWVHTAQQQQQPWRHVQMIGSLLLPNNLKFLKKQFHVIHCIQKKKKKKKKKKRKTRLAFRCCERKRTTVFLGTREFVPAGGRIGDL